MKKISLISLAALVSMVFMTGCGDSKPAVEAKKTYKFTTVEVYDKSCQKCHGAKGEGNPKKKTPALNDRTVAELAQELYDVKYGGTDIGGSGTDHEIMEHNMQKLIEKGYDYDINDMAKHLHSLISK